jgi:pimeloyl-ACP methyl ester carboxylesterase
MLYLPGADALERESRILQLTSNLPVDRAVLQSWADHARTAPVTPSNALRQAVAAGCYRAPRAAPPVPMLLLASRRDRLVDVACSRAIARAWNVPLVEHASAGHDLPLDDPDWTIERILEWRAAPRF